MKTYSFTKLIPKASKIKNGLTCLILFSSFLAINLQAEFVATASNENRRSPAAQAVDNDFRTSWSCSKKGVQSLTVDLSKDELIRGFVYIPFLNSLSGRVKEYKVETSLDQKTWQEVNKGTFTNPVNVSMWPDRKDKIGRIKLAKTIKARYYRLTILSTFNNGPARLNEFLPVVTEKEPYFGETMATLKGLRYAPSIHLSYKLPNASVYYNEIEITNSAPGSFFMGIGFNQGYFGIQETNQGKKWFLFSIWDSKSHDKNSQLAEKRVIAEHKAPKTRAQRFGHEGSGGQSFYDYDWKVGEKIKFVLKIEDHGERRHYKSYFYHNIEKRWVHMLTFSSIAPQKHLSRFHSFVEDFRRNYDSFNIHRGMKIHQAWAKGLDGKWHYAEQSRFTRDGNPHTNITAYTDENAFYFGTGGKVKKEVKPGEQIKRPGLKTPPTDLPFK